MFLGLLLILLAGIIGMALGCLISAVAARHHSFEIVQALGYLLLMTGCLAWTICSPPIPLSTSSLATLAFVAMLSGGCSYLSYTFVSKAMCCGPNGLIWGILQAGLVGTFLMGIFCFGEKASWQRVIGICLILLGVLTISFSKENGNKQRHAHWKWLALLALLLQIIAQVTCALPSFIPGASACGIVFRTMFSCMGSSIVFGIFSFQKQQFKESIRSAVIWKYVFILISLLILNSLFLLNGLDILAEHQMGSLGIPICSSISIVTFALYSIILLHERPKSLEMTGLGELLLGCGIIAL